MNKTRTNKKSIKKPNPPTPDKRGKFANVAELIRATALNKAFAEETISEIRKRSMIDKLMALRAKCGLNQQEIAEKMGCTQSRISKLENGNDDDMRIGDVREYVDAIGLEMSIQLNRKNSQIIDQIKQHTFAVRRLLNRLVELSKGDPATENGANSFCGEVLHNSASSVFNAVQQLDLQLQSAHKNGILPELPSESPPLIQFRSGGDDSAVETVQVG